MSSDISESWSDRRRAHEDEYFRKRDQELVERARLLAEEQAAFQRLAEAADVGDEDILRELQRLGYTAETVKLLYVVPLIDVAFADGTVSEPERAAIIAASRAHGVEPESPADRQVVQWLTEPPSAVLFDGTLHVLGALLQRRPPDQRAAVTRDLLDSCATVASASGGILGIRTISDKEQRVVDRIRYELEACSASGRCFGFER
jgi:hypothetical protein